MVRWWAVLAGAIMAAVLAPPVAPNANSLTGRLLVVDPGHGGTDPGAIGFGLEEEDVTLDVGLRFRDLLEAEGATVLLTRTTDATVSLAARVALANDNDADRYISIHANACGGCGGHGTETYYHDSLPPTSTSASLAGQAQDEVVSHLGTTDRGAKTADFFVLRETNMPAVLVETAFIDHAGDNAILADADQRQEIARALLHAVQTHFGVPPHDPGGPDTTPPAITVTSPDLSGWLTGTVTFEAAIAEASGLAWARAQVDGGTWLWDSFAPHEWTWDTTRFADGPHTIHVQAKDNAGNVGDRSASFKVDNSPPQVDLVAPDDGDLVILGATVRADATDAASGVDRVEFFIDGDLRRTDTEAPYEWSWTAVLEPGFHEVAARGIDRAGLSADDSATVLVV